MDGCRCNGPAGVSTFVTAASLTTATTSNYSTGDDEERYPSHHTQYHYPKITTANTIKIQNKKNKKADMFTFAGAW